MIGADARRPKRILAAVHTQTSDPGEQALNVSIVELALTLRDIEDGEITVFEAWSVFGENLLRSRMPAEQLSTISEEIRTAVEADVRTLLAGRRTLPGIARVELAMGTPGDVIPAYVATQGMDLVVMGTVARTGVGGLVMGNTAERVLQRLKGDVLAVKPPGFMSQVELEG